jgi:PleD family two-component response regulator
MDKLLKTRPVKLTLPPDPEPEDAVFHGASSAKAATAPTPGATHRPQRILVVDDDTASGAEPIARSGLRQLGTEVLIRPGYQVDAVEDNTAGWKALQTRTDDLLITDLDIMPKLSGLKLVKKLRAARMARPVILV